MNRMDDMTYTIGQVRAALMEQWKTNAEAFKLLRNDCGTYVFDAVMAVLLGGTGTSKPHHKAYLSLISNSGDVGAWKANAGLKANKADGWTNYQQRGFFNFPNVDNNRLKTEFPEEMTLKTVCLIVVGYEDDCFRKNMRNLNSAPREDFVKTLHKIVEYAFQNDNPALLDQPFKPETEKREPAMSAPPKQETIITVPETAKVQPKIDQKPEGTETMTDMKKVYAYLSEHEPPIADSISYASELLLTELDAALQALKKRRMDAVEQDDDRMLSVLTAYRDTLNQYKTNISGYLDSITEAADSDAPQATANGGPVDYSLYKADGSIAHHLRDDFMHKKIGAFSFDGTRYSVNTWKDALILLCNLLSKEFPAKFPTIVNDPRFKGRKHQYFSNASVKGKNEKVYHTNVYVWINLSANSIAELMADTLEFFGKNVNDFKVYLRADYTALHEQ